MLHLYRRGDFFYQPDFYLHLKIRPYIHGPRTIIFQTRQKINTTQKTCSPQQQFRKIRINPKGIEHLSKLAQFY